MASRRPHVAHLLARLWIVAGAAVLLGGAPVSSHSGIRHYDNDSAGKEGYQYVSPVPGSKLVSPRNNIALRQGSPIDESSLATASLTVSGVTSGSHAGKLVLSDDARTVLFLPYVPYAAGEKVEVVFQGGIRTRQGDCLPKLDFDFTVAAVDPNQPWQEGLREALSEAPPAANAPGPAPDAAPPVTTAADCGSLPGAYPSLTLRVSDHPEPGYVFLSPFSRTSSGKLVIVDNLGNPIFFRRLPLPSTDFKMQPDGRLTYFSQGSGSEPSKFYAMDASYSIVDSFATGNGYQTDTHDMQILPGNHALLLSYDPEPVRMDLVVPGGKANAVVVGLVVQEIDADKNVVFQWRSWDHFGITDATSPLAALTSLTVDYVHGNSIEPDVDGNLLLSSRHLCEITKIDRQTGEVLWRMGPHASQNQFTFVGDDRGFSHQHSAHRLPNGHITLFDNGNLISPQYSRALEFKIDEAAKNATLVWEYRDVPDVYGGFMGNVQRHESGGTMIGWGGSDPTPKLTELHPDGTKAYEITMLSGTYTYRAFRFPFRTTRLTADATSLDFGEVPLGQPASRSVTVRNPGSDPITIGCAFSTDSAFDVVAPLPVSLDPGGSMQVEVRFDPTLEQPYAAKLYVRSTSTTELVAQDVELAGAGVASPPPGAAHAPPSELCSADRVGLAARREDGGTVSIEFTPPGEGAFALAVFDVAGRRIATLDGSARSAGRQRVVWNTSGVPSGMYFLRLRAGTFAINRPILVVR